MSQVTIKDVAMHAGVSVGTVSHFFNHPDRVTPKTREKVEASIEALNFVRNIQAGILRSGRSPIVGMVVHDISNPFFAEAATAVEDRLREHKLLMTLSSSRASLATESQFLRSLHKFKVRGLLLSPCSDNLSVAEQIAQSGTPVVLLDAVSNSAHLSSVAVDDVHGTHLAVQHLIEIGRRNLVFLNGPRQIRQARSRSLGARQAWEEAGLDPAQLREINCDAFNAPCAQAAATKALTGGHVDAFFCGNDLMALGAYNALRTIGARIPDDVAVVGFDDTAMAAQLATPLTTVRQPMRELGRATVDLLLRDDGTVEHLYLRPSLVVRDSTISTN